MEKKVYERIQIMLKNKRISANELAKILGISSTSVYNYLSGEVRSPLSFAIMILESFPDVSAEWLLRGEGEMMKPTRQSHYLEMAARVNGTYLASESEEPQTWQQAFDKLQKQLNEIKSKIQ